MVGGQYLDLTDAARESPAALRRVHSLKTGRLISCAVDCAIVLARPRPGRGPRGCARYARELGLLFQIVDDILDVEGSEMDLGKSVGADARQGTITYVSTHGLEGARRLAGEAHARALEALERSAARRLRRPGGHRRPDLRAPELSTRPGRGG